jgi:hypothetical protein
VDDLRVGITHEQPLAPVRAQRKRREHRVDVLLAEEAFSQQLPERPGRLEVSAGHQLADEPDPRGFGRGRPLQRLRERLEDDALGLATAAQDGRENRDGCNRHPPAIRTHGARRA